MFQALSIGIFTAANRTKNGANQNENAFDKIEQKIS